MRKTILSFVIFISTFIFSSTVFAGTEDNDQFESSRKDDAIDTSVQKASNQKNSFSLLQLNVGEELLEPILGNVQVSLLSSSTEEKTKGQSQTKFGLIEIEIKQSPIVGNMNVKVLNDEKKSSSAGKTLTGGLISAKVDNSIVGQASVGLLDGKRYVSDSGVTSSGGLANIQLQNDVVGNVNVGLGNASRVETDHYTQNNLNLMQVGTEKLPVIGDTSINIGVEIIDKKKKDDYENSPVQEEPNKPKPSESNPTINVEDELIFEPVVNDPLSNSKENPSTIPAEQIGTDPLPVLKDVEAEHLNVLVVPSPVDVNNGLFTNHQKVTTSTKMNNDPLPNETNEITTILLAPPISQGATTIVTNGQTTSSITGYSFAEMIAAFIETAKGIDPANYFKWLKKQDELKTKWLKSPLMKPPEVPFSF